MNIKGVYSYLEIPIQSQIKQIFRMYICTSFPVLWYDILRQNILDDNPKYSVSVKLQFG